MDNTIISLKTPYIVKANHPIVKALCRLVKAAYIS